MQMDESGKTEKECHAEMPDETHDEAEDMKEDVMLTTPEAFLLFLSTPKFLSHSVAWFLHSYFEYYSSTN